MHRFFNSLPLRYSALALCALVVCISSYTLATSGKGLWWLIAAALLVLLGNLVADLLYSLVDPRIRY